MIHLFYRTGYLAVLCAFSLVLAGCSERQEQTGLQPLPKYMTWECVRADGSFLSMHSVESAVPWCSKGTVRNVAIRGPERVCLRINRDMSSTRIPCPKN